MTKKNINKIFSSVITKNLNWEISTKNLVTFKRWDGVNDKKKLILWKFTETPIFLGCVCVCVGGP